MRGRVELIDRLATWLISFSGIAIIAAVLGIGVFLTIELLPLLRGARVAAEQARVVTAPDAPVFWVTVDEHRARSAWLGPAPELRTADLLRNELPGRQPIPGLEGQRLSSVASALQGMVALGTEQGRVWIGRVALVTAFEGSTRAVRTVIEPGIVIDAVPGQRIKRLAARESGARILIASIVESHRKARGPLADAPGGANIPPPAWEGANPTGPRPRPGPDGGVDPSRLMVTRIATERPLVGPARRTQDTLELPLQAPGQPTTVLIDETASHLFVGLDNGRVSRWRIPIEGDAELVETIDAVPGHAVSEMAWLIGERSIVIGGADGSLASWSLVNDAAAVDGRRLTRIHPFPSHASGIVSLAASPRDKGFLAASTDGLVRLYHMTTEHMLAQAPLDGRVQALTFAPKADGLVAITRTGALHHWRIDNPHPEFSWRTLFGKVWYEGYETPAYIWQSHGGTDDFESKFSLVPLVFGTLKGTLYALLFALPIALFGALYCSQFLEKRLRSPVKSTVELMAALPSVVLGFMAGVVLGPFVQDHLVSVLTMPVIAPAVVIAGLAASRRAPSAAWQRTMRRHEFWCVVGWLIVGVLAAMAVGPWFERWAFGGDAEAWLLRTTGIRYDQRNALVVGWTMGFAVIPIIFTMCEDAFSAVPSHLVAASLACGASPWQTALRVVLPAAGSGVFSAAMVGFGRAIGETMIVLMATGNTPVIDWTVFNGFRALSANIAVEIPEAPYGSTHYRILFVAAMLLFLMAFAVNTVAETVRLRLRRQLQGL